MARFPGNWREVEGRAVFYRSVPAAANPAADAPALPLLLLHGLGCTGEAWKPSLKLLHEARLPAPVLVPDLPGHGRSPKPETIYSMEDFADWAVRLLDLYEIPKAHIVGNSMGCQIAMAMAWRHPSRVGGMVLQGPTMGIHLMPAWRYAVSLALDSVAEPLTYNLLLAKMYLQMGVPYYLATTLKMLENDPLEYCRQIVAPTLIVRGGNDLIIPDAAARKLTMALPDAAYTPLDGTAHAIEYAAPELFVPAVLNFLHRAEAKMKVSVER